VCNTCREKGNRAHIKYFCAAEIPFCYWYHWHCFPGPSELGILVSNVLRHSFCSFVPYKDRTPPRPHRTFIFSIHTSTSMLLPFCPFQSPSFPFGRPHSQHALCIGLELEAEACLSSRSAPESLLRTPNVVPLLDQAHGKRNAYMSLCVN
jgi:hypothetical protein